MDPDRRKTRPYFTSMVVFLLDEACAGKKTAVKILDQKFGRIGVLLGLIDGAAQNMPRAWFHLQKFGVGRDVDAKSWEQFLWEARG